MGRLISRADGCIAEQNQIGGKLFEQYFSRGIKKIHAGKRTDPLDGVRINGD